MSARQNSSARVPIQEELVIRRVFDAPREEVWKHWTDPAHFMRWWGPQGFTCPVCRIDFHVGGKYFFCMRTPEGEDIWGTGIYREIVPTERIVYTDHFADPEGNVVDASYYKMPGEWPREMTVTVTFDEEGGRTVMTLEHEGIPQHIKADCVAGWSESFDKLDEFLEKKRGLTG